MGSDNSTWADQWGTNGDAYGGENSNSSSITKGKRKSGGNKMETVKSAASAGFGKAAVGTKKVAKIGFVKAKVVAAIGAKKVKIGTVLGFKWVKAKCKKK